MQIGVIYGGLYLYDVMDVSRLHKMINSTSCDVHVPTCFCTETISLYYNTKRSYYNLLLWS